MNGAVSVVANIDESGVPTFAIGGKGSAESAVIVDGGGGSLKSRTLAEFKGYAALGNAEHKSSATIRGEIVDGTIPNLNVSKINAGTFDSERVKHICTTHHCVTNVINTIRNKSTIFYLTNI